MNAIAEVTPTRANESTSRDQEYKSNCRRLTQLHLAADLLGRALQRRFDDLHLSLIRVKDAGLLESDETLEGMAESLIRSSSDLDNSLYKTFPRSQHGSAKFVRDRSQTLTAEIEVYRQEAFWCMNEDAERAAEDLIRAIFEFYKEAEELMRLIEAQFALDEPNFHEGAPSYVANRFLERE